MSIKKDNLESGFFMVYITEQTLKRLYAEENPDNRAIRIMESKFDAFTSLLDVMDLMPEYEVYKTARDANGRTDT